MRKILLFWLFSLVFSYSINAQSASTYSFAASTGTYTQVNDATATRLNLVEADSYLSTAQSIGFNFVYEGITYTQFKMGSNGFISLNSSGTATLTTNNFSTANSTSRPIIAPLWDDLDGRSTGSVSAAYFEVTGSAPNRVLTVEWRNWEWNYASSTPVISFQAKLYETTNIIEFVYRSETGTPSSGSASIGIGSATGSGNNSYLNLTSTTTPAVSSISSVTTLSTKPATGQVYTFTPPTPCSGAPLAGTVSGPASACSGIGFNITATGYSTGVSGMTYRWQTATSATGPWTNTTGTSPASFTATQTSTAFYRLVDTCTNSGIGAESNVISVTIGNASYSSLPFFESFENIWIDGCNTKDIPTNNWRNSPATTDSSWRRDDDAASGGNTAIWGSTTSYMYTPASSNGSRSARFHSGNITAGRRGIFDLYIDCSSGVATKQLSFDYINTSGTDSLVISMSTDGGVSFARLDSITLRTAWTNKLVNFTSTSSTTILRFTATADFGSTDIGLDNVNVVVLNTCSGTPTTGIISSNSTTVCAGSSVSFSSSTYTIATGMTYRWQTSATGSDPWTNTTTTSASSYSFTFSTPVWVRRVDTCTNTGQFAISNAVQISINAATYASLPFTESFEATWIDGCGATGSQSIPNVNWRNTPVTGNNSWRRNDETTTNSGWSSTSGAYSPTFSAGAYSARIHTYSTSTPGSLDLYLDCNSGAATKQLSYDYINTSGSDSLKVFLSIDGGSTFNFIGTKNTTTTTWSNFIIPFTSSSATTVIRFTAYGDFGLTDIGLDNLNVLILNNCSGTPSAGTINGPSSSPCLGSSVTLTASGYTNGVIGLTYRWQSSTDNINWVNTIGTNPASFTTIVNGNIWFRLVDTCTNSNQFAVSNVINVNTQTAYTTPWSENFDAMTTLGAGILPSCWLNVTGTNAFTSANAASNTYNDPLSAPNYVTVYYPYTTGSYLWTPAFQLTAGTSYDFSFYFAGDATAGWVGDVFYNTSQSATGATALGASFVTASTTTVKTYNQVTRTFTPTLSGVYYFGIKAFASTSAPYYMGFDDFKLDLTPSCVIPTAVVSSNVTGTAASIAWTAPTLGTTPSGYEYVVSTNNTTPTAAGTAVTNPRANLTGLTANTTYYVFVRTNCGSGNFSAWTTSVSFTTPCNTSNLPISEGFNTSGTTVFPNCWSQQIVVGTSSISFAVSSSNPTTTPQEGSRYAFWNGYSISSGNETRLVSLPINTVGTASVDVKFQWFYDNSAYTTASYTDEGMFVEYSLDGIIWTVVGSQITRLSATNSGWTPVTVTLPVGAGNQTQIYVGFRFRSRLGNNCSLDNVTIQATPSCVIPSALTSSNVTTTTATINWTAPTLGTTPTGYEYVVSTTNTTPTAAGTAVTNATANITGLTANTTYYVFVRTNCGGGNFSDWSGSILFSTPCSTVTNFSENFDALTTVGTGVFPSCWYKVGSTGSAYAQASTAISSPNNLYIYSSTTSNLAVVSMPPVSNASNGNYRLKFKARANITAGGILEVGYLTDPLNASTFVALSTFTTTSTTTVDNFVLSPVITPAGITTLAFRHTGSPANSILVDDVIYEAIPLPVTITQFSGSKQANINLLSWTTASEQNNKGFELQRSADGVNYSTLTFVNSKAINGNSNTTLDYTFTDTKPFIGNSYYRLKQLDKDGKESLSQVVLIKGSKGTQLDITSIYPNPTTSQLNVIMSAPSRDKVTIVITDVAGKVLLQKIVNVVAGDNGIQLDVSKLVSGTYIMKAICENGCDSGSKKFMKQ